MSDFLRKNDEVRLLTIEELQKKCYLVKSDWAGLWIVEHTHRPQVHAYLQNEIYLLGSKGRVVASSYDYFVTVEVYGYGTINIPSVCLEKIEKEVEVPELNDEYIDDVVQVMIEQDEVDIAHILDGYEYTVEYDMEAQMVKSIQQIAKEHKNVEATPYVLEGNNEDADNRTREERLADTYKKVILAKLQLDEVLEEINELLSLEEE
jgi:hypothetical protein